MIFVRSLFRSILFAVCILTIASPTLFAYDTTNVKWDLDFEEDIEYMRLIEDSMLLVGTESAISSFNATNGAVNWRILMSDTVHGWNVGHIEGTHYAVMLRSKVRKERSYSKMYGGGIVEKRNNVMSLLDLRDGSELWKSEEWDIHSVVGYFATPDSSKLLLMTVDTARTRSLSCVDFWTGRPIWHNDSTFSSRLPLLYPDNSLDSMIIGQQLPVFDTDSTLITFLSPSRVRKWNFKTGAGIWEAELRDEFLAPISRGFMQMRLSKDGNRIHVPLYKHLYCLDVSTGDIVWRSPAMYGEVYQMEVAPEGLLVRGGFEKSGESGWKAYMMLLDPETGEYLWEKQMTKLKTARTSNFVLKGNFAYICSDRKFKRIHVASGVQEEIAKNLDIRGNIRMFKEGEDFRLISGETVALIKENGEFVFNSTHRLASGTGFWETVGIIATVVVISALIVANASSAYSSSGNNYVYVPQVSYSETRFSELAVASDRSICMVTDLELGGYKKPGVVRVDLVDGAVIGSVNLEDSKPWFTFSESHSLLYWVHNNSRVTAFSF